jgi:hypothetical protein
MLQEAVESCLDSAFESNLPYLRHVPKAQDPRQTSPDSVIEEFVMRMGLAVQARA